MNSLRVQTGWVWDAEFIGYFAAQQTGIYRSSELDVSFLEGGPLADPEAEVLSGQADVSISVPDSVAARVAKGDDLVVIGRQYRRDPLAIIVTKQSGRSRLAELVGLNLYVPEVSRMRVQTVLAEHGIGPADVVYRPFETRPRALAAPLPAAVAGYLTSMPDDIEREGSGELTVIPLDSEDVPTIQNVIATTRDMLLTRPNELRRFLDASSAGWRRNSEDLRFYPRHFRSTWYKNLDRPVDSEIRHNESQQSFVADDFALDLDAVKSLERIGASHGLSHSKWIAAV